MAGGHYGIKHDPAIERWYTMRESMHQNFRLTRNGTRTGLVLMVLVPGLLYWTFKHEDMRWNWVAKRKGQSLLRVPPPEESESNST